MNSSNVDRTERPPHGLLPTTAGPPCDGRPTGGSADPSGLPAPGGSVPALTPEQARQLGRALSWCRMPLTVAYAVGDLLADVSHIAHQSPCGMPGPDVCDRLANSLARVQAARDAEQVRRAAELRDTWARHTRRRT